MDARLQRIKELFWESEKRNGELSYENFELKKRIAELEEIDIVHCKECKYADTQPFRMDSREKEARNLFCGRTLKYVDMDWFCADGERRTE